MQVYLTMLLEEYKRTLGFKTIDLSSKEFVEGFNDWLSKKHIQGQTYIGLLEYMKLYDESKENAAEVGKGKYDSVVLPYDTGIITPYSKGIKVDDTDRIIPTNFMVKSNGEIILFKSHKSKVKTLSFNQFEDYRGITFMTQNPYTALNIKNWEHIPNSGNYDIIVGVYGNVRDKDKNQKLNALRELRDKLQFGYREDGAVWNDDYYYVIASDSKLKEKTKIR